MHNDVPHGGRDKIKVNCVLRLEKSDLLATTTNFLCFCYLVLLFFVQTMKITPLISIVANSFLVAGAAASLILNLSRKNSSDWYYYIIFAAISWLYVYLIRSAWKYDINSIIATGCHMLIGLNFAKSKHNTVAYNWLFYIITVVLLLRIVVFGDELDSIINSSSRNFISVLALTYLVIAVKIQDQNHVSISIKEIVLILLVTLFSVGRGGILSGAVFATLALVFLVKRLRNLSLKIILVLTVGVILVFSAHRLWQMVLGTGLLDRFVTLAFYSSGRSQIWSRYLSTCFESIGSFVCGGSPAFLRDGNIHNSFFQMYATFGLPFFVTNIIIIIKLFIRKIRCRDYQSLIVALAFLIRCLTDRVLFRGYGEIAYFFIIFDYLCNKKSPNGAKVLHAKNPEAIDNMGLQMRN